MNRTLTAVKALMLLRGVGVPQEKIDELVAAGEVIARECRSARLGFRHLLMAVDVEEEGKPSA